MRKCSKCGNAPIGTGVKFCNVCGSSEIFDTEGKVSEYRRTCNQCGATWHSLTSREAKIKRGANNGLDCCNMCDQNAQNRAAAERNTYKSELERLRLCPKCGSGDYSEEEIMYDRK